MIFLMTEGDGAAIPLERVAGFFIISTSERDPERPKDRAANRDVFAIIASVEPDRRGTHYVLAAFPRTDKGEDDAHDALDLLTIELTNESPGVYRWDSERQMWGVLRYTDPDDYTDEPDP